MPDSSIRISLKYRGREGEDSSMPIGEVITALQGFAGAYGKVAQKTIPESTHELRVQAVKPGSFDWAIVAWVTSAHGAEALKAIGIAKDSAKYVYEIVRDYIELKKEVKGQPATLKVEGSGNTTLVFNNGSGTQIISSELVELYKTKQIDADLAKIVAPLEEGGLEFAELTETDDEGAETTSISFGDKLSFVTPAVPETTQEAKLVGRLVSFNKETKRGLFATGNGARVQYVYTGGDPIGFNAVFGFSGAVKISGIAYFDENLVLKHIDISGAIIVQASFDFPPNTEEKSQ